MSEALGYIQQYDAFIIPIKNISSSAFTNPLSSANLFTSVLGTGFSIGGTLGLSGVLQLEQDKGNVITAHRVDGGYALTQRGGKNDDRVFVRLILTGSRRLLFSEILKYYADNKSIPLMFLSREVRLAKCQIESFKLIANSERRQALIIHLIFRQLRSFQDNILANVANWGLATLAGSAFMNEEDLYDNAQTPGVSSILLDISSSVANAGVKALAGVGAGG